MNASRFSVLVDRLESLSPEDTADLQHARIEIIELKNVLEQVRQRELADFLGAADAMIRSINVLNGEPFDQVRELVCSLLTVVGNSVDGLAGHSATTPSAALPAGVDEAVNAEPATGLGRTPLSLEGETPSGTYTGIRTMSELLLGQILVDSEKLTRPQLVAALKHQKNEDMHIGQALVELDFVSDEDVEEALTKQSELAHGQPASHAMSCTTALHEMRLGQILVRVGGVSEQDLNHALQIQRATGKRLGEAIVELGVATWERVEKAAQIQTNARGDSDGGSSSIEGMSLRLGE